MTLLGSFDEPLPVNSKQPHLAMVYSQGNAIFEYASPRSKIPAAYIQPLSRPVTETARAGDDDWRFGMEASKKAASVERQERTALARARCRAPEQDPSLAVFGRDVDAYDGQSSETAPEDSTAQDWLVADAARRDFDDETTDGLDAV